MAKYQNSSDLNAAMTQAVERRKAQEKKNVDPKERWKQGLAANRKKRSILLAVILIPTAVIALIGGAYAMGFRVGKPGALAAALDAPESTTELRLVGAKLGEFPEEIKTVTALRELYLGNNTLKSLPPSVGELKRLQILSLMYNEVGSIPDELAKLEGLTTLDLKNNKLTSLPDSIVNLKSLKTLDLTNNGLTELPKDIGKLTTLEVLELGGNNISKLPQSLAKLKNLRVLDLSGNPVFKLPEPSCFPGLRRLDLVDTNVPDATISSFRVTLAKASVMK